MQLSLAYYEISKFKISTPTCIILKSLQSALTPTLLPSCLEPSSKRFFVTKIIVIVNLGIVRHFDELGGVIWQTQTAVMAVLEFNQVIHLSSGHCWRRAQTPHSRWVIPRLLLSPKKWSRKKSSRSSNPSESNRDTKKKKFMLVLNRNAT